VDAGIVYTQPVRPEKQDCADVRTNDKKGKRSKAERKRGQIDKSRMKREGVPRREYLGAMEPQLTFGALRKNELPWREKDRTGGGKVTSPCLKRGRRATKGN